MKCYYSEAIQLEKEQVDAAEWVIEGAKRAWKVIVEVIEELFKPILKMAKVVFKAYKLYRAKYNLKVRSNMFKLRHKTRWMRSQVDFRKPLRRVARSDL
ncbi:hypothetical protein ACTHQ4_10255 [Alkalicoccobacillus gibsonii]|uniref:hypothetical protein n=1 Tax=Alkalicoccobacillus gibsonii TaxID=79881 RepID=UPI003F7C91FD